MLLCGILIELIHFILLIETGERSKTHAAVSVPGVGRWVRDYTDHCTVQVGRGRGLGRRGKREESCLPGLSSLEQQLLL